MSAIPAWFKRLPQTEESKPNALFLRKVDDLNGEEVCEIKYLGQIWLVRRTEVFVGEHAHAEAAIQMQKFIDSKRVPGQSRVQLAKACGISEGTLRKRMAYIQNHLPRNPELPMKKV